MKMPDRNSIISRTKEAHRGFVIAELIMALAIIGTLMLGLAISLDTFARYNKYQMLRQRCTAAARAQLDSIATTGTPIDNRDIERLWPKITVSFDSSPGTGQWHGLELLQVNAAATDARREVKVRLARYIPKEPD